MSTNTRTDDLLAEMPLVPAPAAEQLNDKQETIYRDHRTKLARWALSIGKHPKKGKGYATATVKGRLYRLDKFYRFVRDHDRYTIDITPEHADA